MKIYGFAPSPNTWKCRALAAHLRVPLEYVEVNIVKGENREPDFLALNPRGRTPALVDGDFTLWESSAILHYIASKKPGDIHPDDPKMRADIVRWQSWQLSHWGADACVPLGFENIVKKFFDMGPPDKDVVAKALEVFALEAELLDKHLDGRSWLVGNSVTIADFSVGAALFYAKESQMPLEDYKNAAAWFSRLSALPCWGETAPQMGAA